MPASREDNYSWVDIYPPQMPMEVVDPWIYMLLISVLLLSAIVGLYFYFNPRFKAKRRLRKMKSMLQGASAIDGREISSQLKQCLCLGFAIEQVDLSTRFKQQSWQDYLGILDEYCYGSQKVSRDQLTVLLVETSAWLDARE